MSTTTWIVVGVVIVVIIVAAIVFFVMRSNSQTRQRSRQRPAAHPGGRGERTVQKQAPSGRAAKQTVQHGRRGGRRDR